MILIVARGLPSKKYKMNGIFEFDQANALSKQGLKVIYLALDMRSILRWRNWGISRQKIENLDVWTVNFPLGAIPRKIRSFLSSKILKKSYNKIVDKLGKPKLIHAHFTEPGFIASKLVAEIDIPLVITEHSSQINKKNIEPDLFQMAKVAYTTADQLIAVSPALCQRINENFKVECTYIPNLVDLEIFSYSEFEEKEQFIFVSTGNLIKIKNMELTVRAFIKSFKDSKNVYLHIFGEGPERENLENLIHNNNMENNIILRGLCSRQEIANTLKKSSCFVLASQSETFGVAYIEALAMGVPVIATKCGGPETFVNSHNGVLVELNDQEALATKMQAMYSNIELYDRKSISDNIKKQFSAQAVAEQILDVYKKVLG